MFPNLKTIGLDMVSDSLMEGFEVPEGLGI